MKKSCIIVLSSTLLAIACLGGGCGSTSGGGIGGTGIAQGVIGDFGSIFVNDIEFDISMADVLVNGVPANELDLRLGMVVTVTGTIDEATQTGVADSVRFDRVLRGPVRSVDLPGREARVLGQTLVFRNDTVFDGVTLPTLVQNQLVEVSGFVDADGVVRVTRLAALAPGAPFEVKGRIKNLDDTAQSFDLRTINVDFAGAALVNVPPSGLSDGLLVSITASADVAGNVLAVTHVEVLESRLRLTAGLELKIDGIITSVDGPGRFTVDGIVPVRINPGTILVDGTAGDIGLNTRVRVRGTVNRNLRLVADRLRFIDPDALSVPPAPLTEIAGVSGNLP